MAVGAGGNSGTLSRVEESAASAKLPATSEHKIHAVTVRNIITVPAGLVDGGMWPSEVCDSILPLPCETLTPNSIQPLLRLQDQSACRQSRLTNSWSSKNKDLATNVSIDDHDFRQSIWYLPTPWSELVNPPSTTLQEIPAHSPAVDP